MSGEMMYAPDLSRARWRKSSRSNGEGNACVEVATLSNAAAMRDSKNVAGPVLVLDQRGWDAFRSVVKEA